ncbi:ribonuclease H-like domain-containing protein [Apodospora peruviana]|uniref:RNA exonuclease 4 n=1 Tax=Apodospora peruviana TaxID=516989 RepID=A0AAE0I6V3_9PEZI|nr:ribonuclease H-like domain-containing protein [Apodospora peruviana]
MAPELSSNWKKLQAKIKAESAAPKPAPKPAPKRKTPGDNSLEEQQQKPPLKKQRSQQGKPSQKASKVAPPKKQDNIPKSKPKPSSSSSQMGITQSSKIDPVLPKKGISPSLALWAADNDISPEDLAEAYGLGAGKTNSMLTETPARPNEGLAPGMEVVGKYIAIDCEMVGVGDGGHEHALARVSVVDFHGRQVYDSFVRPKERVTDWRTHVSGVAPKHMATARTFEEVQAKVAELLKGRILIGHDVKHDTQVLMLDHPHKDIRDTAKFSGFRKYGNGRKPALRTLAQEILSVEIQNGEHSSIEDARVAMLLFRKHKSAFDMEHANRYPDSVPQSFKGKSKKSKKLK